jgi:hypothetical protein
MKNKTKNSVVNKIFLEGLFGENLTIRMMLIFGVTEKITIERKIKNDEINRKQLFSGRVLLC